MNILPRSLRGSIYVWLVPLLALAVSAWLIFREFQHHGPLIEIEFANGASIEAGKTPLLFKGVVVGQVREVALKPQLDGVIVKVELDEGAGPLAVEGSEFWLSQPEIGLSGVKGLDTLLSGARLIVRAGSGAPATHFKALPRAPAREGLGAGRSYTLRTAGLGSLRTGTGVYFRDMKVGVIENFRLSSDSTQVLVDCRILEPYHLLVRVDTRFWNSGGISMKIGLLGANIHSDSLESLVGGGVSFATPEESAEGAVAPEGTVFELHDRPEKAWEAWSPKIALPAETR
ncbi:MAG: MlaD family protein, partial [Lacunisphaera sp.]